MKKEEEDYMDKWVREHPKEAFEVADDPCEEMLEEEANKVECEECGFKGTKDDCDTTEANVTTVGGDYLLIVTYLCPECGEILGSDEYPGDLGIGPTYGDYDPDHAGWDPGDYGDYGELGD